MTCWRMKSNNPIFSNTLKTVAEERQSGITIYPPQKDVFNAFRFTELGDVKVVILGQDPITARVRPMVWRSQFVRASRSRLRC